MQEYRITKQSSKQRQFLKKQLERDLKKLKTIGYELDQTAMDRKMQKIHIKTNQMTVSMMDRELGVGDGWQTGRFNNEAADNPSTLEQTVLDSNSLRPSPNRLASAHRNEMIIELQSLIQELEAPNMHANEIGLEDQENLSSINDLRSI